MPRARDWADQFEEGIKAYNFSEDKIYRHNDADYETIDDAIFDSTIGKIRQNTQQGRRTLLLCFYAGHGANHDNSKYALLNSNLRLEDYGNQYDLEHALGSSCA